MFDIISSRTIEIRHWNTDDGTRPPTGEETLVIRVKLLQEPGANLLLVGAVAFVDAVEASFGGILEVYDKYGWGNSPFKGLIYPFVQSELLWIEQALGVDELFVEDVVADGNLSKGQFLGIQLFYSTCEKVQL
jgi:hypothetical protein